MKIRITLKDPDGVSNSIEYAARASIPDGLSHKELEVVEELRVEKIKDQLEPWVSCGEYVTIEIDTETKSATVVRQELQ